MTRRKITVHLNEDVFDEVYAKMANAPSSVDID